MVRHSSSRRRSRKKKSKSKFRGIRGTLGKRVNLTDGDIEKPDTKRTRTDTDRTPSEYLAFVWPDVKAFYDTNKKSRPTRV